MLLEKTSGPCPAQEVRILKAPPASPLGRISPAHELNCIELPQNEAFGGGDSLSSSGQKLIQWQQVLATPWEEAGAPPGAPAASCLIEAHPPLTSVLAC